MRTQVKKEVDMSSEKRSSTPRAREARTNSYRNRFEKNHVKARNPWPDPFTSRQHTQVERTSNQETVVRSRDHSRSSKSKSDHQDKKRK